jgi:hypothetical protein
MGDGETHKSFQLENMKARHHFEDLDIDGRIK